MGERWQRKYGRKKNLALDAAISKRWLDKYGKKFGLADYDPNQPRDERGRWTRIGGAAGERMSMVEMEARYDKISQMSGLSQKPDLGVELSVLSGRFGVDDLRETFETPIVITIDGQPITNNQALATLGISSAEIEEIKNDAIRLEEKYGEPVEINFADPPPGTTFDGWINAGNQGSGSLVVNINKHTLTNTAQQHSDRNFASETREPPAGNRRLHFGIGRWKDELASEGFNLGTFVSENPDYANAVRFTVRGDPPSGNRLERIKTILRHEYAHIVHLSAGARRKREIDEIVSGMSQSRRWLISDYARTNGNETWAEAFTMYENHPHLAEQVLPGPLIGYIKALHGG